tara:strand:- start:1037 stop:1567 length:531 start_codon:yes stop_codon:yes gene_type:complete
MTEVIAAWKNNSLEPVEKLEVHKTGLKHPAVSVFVKQKENILIQQRSSTKYHSPELWANTVCTHPHWGEELETCALRRLSEELGIGTLDLQFRSEIEYRAEVGNGLIEHEVVSVFVSELSEDLDLYIKPNPTEVKSVRWIKFSDLEKEITLFPGRFTEWLKIYLTQYSKNIFIQDL